MSEKIKIKINRACVGDAGETLEKGKTYEQSGRTARILCGSGQASLPEPKAAKGKSAPKKGEPKE